MVAGAQVARCCGTWTRVGSGEEETLGSPGGEGTSSQGLWRGCTPPPGEGLPAGVKHQAGTLDEGDTGPSLPRAPGASSGLSFHGALILKEAASSVPSLWRRQENRT